MGIRTFATVCFVLAGLFSFAAIKGMMTHDFQIVFIVPALAAVALILIGLKHYNKA